MFKKYLYNLVIPNHDEIKHFNIYEYLSNEKIMEYFKEI